MILTGDIVTLANDPTARGRVVETAHAGLANTVLVVWDFDTNPYARYELRRNVRVVYFDADGNEDGIEGDDAGYANGHSPIAYTGNA